MPEQRHGASWASPTVVTHIPLTQISAASCGVAQLPAHSLAPGPCHGLEQAGAEGSQGRRGPGADGDSGQGTPDHAPLWAPLNPNPGTWQGGSE